MNSSGAKPQTRISIVRASLQTMREEIDDLSASVADRVWDRFEAEVRLATEGEFMFETANMLAILLGTESSNGFQDGLDELLFERFRSLDRELTESEQAELDLALTEFEGLRKEFKLIWFVENLASGALEEAKPSVGLSIGRILGGIFRDSIEQLDSLESNMRDDAVRVRQALLKCKQQLVNKVQNDGKEIVRTAYSSFVQAIESPSESRSDT